MGHCAVRLTRRYAASPEEVWGALTESDSLARWLDPSCEVSLDGGSDLELADGGIVVRVRTLEPHQLIELDWETNGEPSVVRFELTTDGSGTVLVLDHERIDERIGMAYMQLWTNALNRFQP
jgi:uncharacterized protein YndB with AHSA1/START domain